MINNFISVKNYKNKQILYKYFKLLKPKKKLGIEIKN